MIGQAGDALERLVHTAMDVVYGFATASEWLAAHVSNLALYRYEVAGETEE